MQVVLEIIDTMPVVALLDLRAIPVHLPFRVLRKIRTLLRRQRETVIMGEGRCNKCDVPIDMSQWLRPVQGCAERECVGGIVIRNYHRLETMMFPSNQRLGVATDLARADMIARFAAAVGKYFPACCGDNDDREKNNEEQQVDGGGIEDHDNGAMPRDHFERVWRLEMRRQCRLFGAALEPATKRRWPDATEMNVASEEINWEYLTFAEEDDEMEESMFEDEDDDEFEILDLGKNGNDDANEEENDISKEDQEDEDVEEEFRLMRPASVKLSDLADDLRSALQKRFTKEMEIAQKEAEAHQEHLRQQLGVKDEDEYEYEDDEEEEDEESEWKSYLDSGDEHRLGGSTHDASLSALTKIVKKLMLRGSNRPPTMRASSSSTYLLSLSLSLSLFNSKYTHTHIHTFKLQLKNKKQEGHDLNHQQK
jgi:hypothetical protein